MLNKAHGAGRKLAGLALATGLSFGGLMLAAPAVAEPKEDGKEEVRRIEIREIKGKDRQTLVERDGKELRMIEAKCEGEKVEIGSEGEADGKRDNVKFILCTNKGENMVAALEKAVAEFEKRDEMSAERKADILSKLRAKIAELRARG